MTRKQKIVMNILNATFPAGSIFQQSLFADAIINSGKVSIEEACEICRSLEDMNCISHLQSSLSGIVLTLQIEHKGREYRSIIRDEFKSFLFRSVLIPIIVSLATSVLAILLSALLGFPPSIG